MSKMSKMSGVGVELAPVGDVFGKVSTVVAVQLSCGRIRKGEGRGMGGSVCRSREGRVGTRYQMS